MNCQYCGERFNRYYNLRRHEDDIAHTKNKKLKATIWLKVPLQRKRVMQKHMTSQPCHMIMMNDQGDGDVEIGPWAELIDEAKRSTSSAYEELLQNLIYEGYDEQEAKTEAYSLVLPKLEKALEDVYLERLLWMRDLKQDPVHKKIMRKRDEFVNRDLKIARKLQPQHQSEVTSELDFADFAVSNVAHSSRRRNNSCFGVVAATRGLWRSKYLNRLV